nr:hypothetical protein [Ruminococcus bromii]
MDNYNIRFGEEIGEQAGLTMVDLLAKKAKAAIKQKNVVIMSVESSDETIETIITGSAIDRLGRLGTLTIETIQNIEKDTDKQYAKAMLYGFVRAIQAAFERR